jgi:xanthine dehydrogenase YagR molybdenum-binding subunit
MTVDRERPYWLEGVDLPDMPFQDLDEEPWDETKVVGKPRPRVDAYERVSGSAVYPADVVLPRMLYGAILRCPHPHALVKSVDTGRAESMPGVRAVLSAFTAEDAATRPHAEFIRNRLFNPRCRYEGETVAAVAAETPYQAWDAVRAIEVEYERRPFVSDEREALDPDAPLVHDDGNRVAQPSAYERGDVEAGFAAADVVLEQEYRSECEIHTPMEPHGAVAKWDGDQLTLWESTQGVYNVQSGVAGSLGIPFSKVRVIGHYMGGGFGSKLRPGKYTVIAALLAKKTARPVKCVLTREETFLAVGNRPPSNMRLKAGVKRNGTLTAMQFWGTGSGGAYRAGGTSLLDWLVRDLYTCPNVRTETTDIYINAGPARPFRAPGHPQGAWALEQMMDALAVEIGMDPVELRLKNVPAHSQGREGNPPYTTTGLRQCLEEGAESFGWPGARPQAAGDFADGPVRRGVGVAACLWPYGSGAPPATAIVKLYSDGTVNLNTGAADIGTGTKTVLAMVVAEELGVDPDAVQIEHADTGTTQFAAASGGSMTVPTQAPTVRSAALDVQRQLLELAADELGVAVSTLYLKDGKIYSSADPDMEREPRSLRRLQRRRMLTGVGYRAPNPQGKVVNPFAAQFCEVEVDTRTGEVKVLRFVAAHDSGRVMNLLTYRNQVFGGIAMGIGFGMTEARVLDGGQTGKMVNKNWHDYKLPTALDIPTNMECIPVDPDDRECNNTGAKGIGEPATIPTAAAIANAVYHATGVRMTDTPINPSRLVEALAAQKGE